MRFGWENEKSLQTHFVVLLRYKKIIFYSHFTHSFRTKTTQVYVDAETSNLDLEKYKT